MKTRITAAVIALMMALSFNVSAAYAAAAGSAESRSGADARTEDRNGTSGKKKARWVTKKDGKYYRKKDGTYAVGSCKIGGVYYVFDETGRLFTPEAPAHVKYGKTVCYVSPEGKALYGWHFIGKKLYYSTVTGKLKKNCEFQYIRLNKKGAAVSSDLTTWQKMITRTVDSITTYDMTKAEKLKACWDYLTSKSNFSYRLRYPDLDEPHWFRETAYNMLLTGSGNCYSFACTFAAMANQIGYHSYIVCGRISGSRDGAADGLTRHCWVRINGGYYDPEAQFAGFYRNCYGNSGYGIRHEIQRIVKYTTGAVETP